MYSAVCVLNDRVQLADKIMEAPNNGLQYRLLLCSYYLE